MSIKKQINLIPLSMVVPTKLVKLAKTLNKISTAGSIFVILVAAVIISGLVYYNSIHSTNLANLEVLKQKVVDLESNEQTLILAKDKLSKIGYIRSLDSVDNELTSFKEFQSLTVSSASSSLSEVVIDPKKTELSMSFSDTFGLQNVLKIISTLSNDTPGQNSGYEKITLSSLVYNIKSGYLMTLIFNN